MIYHKKSAFCHREFLIIQETMYGQLRKSSTSEFYENSADRRDSMSIFFNELQPFLTLFLTSPVAMATAHTLAKMRK